MNANMIYQQNTSLRSGVGLGKMKTASAMPGG